MTRIVRIVTPGGPEALELIESDLPAPSPGQARVRHTAIGVNFIDIYHRSGLYPMPLPAVLGSEASGVVEAVGDGVDLAIGTRVAYASGPPGAYADARNIDASRLLALPDDVSDETAAAVLLKGLTAEYLLRRTYRVERGDEVLLHAAAGGVGLIASQWLRELGARVIGTVGSDEKARVAKENGVDDAIVYTREDFVARTRELTSGRGVRVAYDSVGKSTLLGSLACLMPRGLLVSFGNASGKPDPLDVLALSQAGSAYLTRPVLGHYIAKREELVLAGAALFDVLRRGAVRAHIHRRFPLSEVREAHRALESRMTTGALLLVP
jgi:NADPH2:quinone reductase